MQTIAERISLDISRLTGDPVSVYTANGRVIKAVQRESAAYEAIGKLYDERLLSLGVDKFAEIYPEFRETLDVITINGGVPNSRIITKDSSIKKIVSIYINSADPAISAVAYPLTNDNYFDALYNQYSIWKPTNAVPYFYEQDRTFSIEILNQAVLIQAALTPLIVKKPVFVAYGATEDYIIPDGWIRNVTELAAAIIMQNQQIL